MGFRSGAVQNSVLPDKSLSETAQYPQRRETFNTELPPDCLLLADIKTKKKLTNNDYSIKGRARNSELRLHIIQ